MRHAAFGFDGKAIHLPEIDLPAVVPPKNVALAVAVEIAAALDVPIVGYRRVRHTAFAIGLQTVHVPEIDLSSFMTPENVAVAVAVEIVVGRRVRAQKNGNVVGAKIGYGEVQSAVPVQVANGD
jgi:hypothetical protein